MARPFLLTRVEAEYLVDLIEIDGVPQFAELAASLRKEWGMATREEQMEAWVNLPKDEPEKP